MAESFDGVLRHDGLDTWYRVVGELDQAAPLVVCHGGPGLTHDYLESLSALADGRAVVFYDQHGTGRSGHRPDAPDGFFSVELYVRELAALLDHLGIAGGYHLLGHSWGGLLGLEHAVRRPAGLRSLTVASGFARSDTYTAEVGALVAALPDDVRTVIETHEAAGTTDSPEYDEAVRVFYRRHVCRAKPVPGEVMRTLVALAEDSTVYRTMAGPSEFRLTGTLAGWDITDRLDAIEVDVLLVSGEHDEVTPGAVGELHRALPGSRWELIPDASHMAHVEHPERFRALVGEFLASAGARVDTVGS
ncbi:proline iminopeptidase-family hydrolase [Actinophytocola oryzae]|uniref:Proline iminopeptidase n=1 Tax=Actinophytocola oryzae TaxID=502181 RepID=A0A4R7W5P9_9PSEU|nr:proline iminopeptidase-family hydrolase [Actinophytocola oryzae]TDV57585.1 L-proline amide hydrolase [Actinophytocola oryzae]